MWWLVGALIGCGEPRQVEPVLALVGDAPRGEATYQMVCAGCHGSQGQGVLRAPPLAGRVRSMSDEDIVTIIIRGRGGMPAKRIADQDVADVLAFLRSGW